MKIPLIPVELTPDIAVKLRFMVESGVFDVRGGNVTLSFDQGGTLKTIKKEIFTYATAVNSGGVMKKNDMIRA